MAEFHFWGAEKDRTQIIEAVLALGDYKLIPDLHYPEPNPQVYERPEQSLFDALSKKIRVYVSGPYSSEPACMEQLKGGRDAGKYYVYEAAGGPLLSLMVPGFKTADGLTELSPGSFSRRAEYWDKAITTPVKASNELKQHYEKILGEIKRHLVRKKLTENVWIGAEAWELLSQDKAIILSNGKWWDGKGSFVRSNLDRPIAS